VSASVERF